MGTINNTNNRRHPAAAAAHRHHHHFYHHYAALLLLNQRRRRRRRRVAIYNHQCFLLFGILLSVLCLSFISSNNYLNNSSSGMILYAKAEVEADTAIDATTSSKTSELVSACSNSENESSNGESSCTEQNQIFEDEQEQEHDHVEEDEYKDQYDEQCIMDAKNGFCEKNPQEMFLRCPYECLEYSAQLGRMIYLPSSSFPQQGRIKHQQQPGKVVFCENKIEDADCEEYVHEQECLKNPEYMLEHCAQSCWNCFVPTLDSDTDTDTDTDTENDTDRTKRREELVAVNIGLTQTLDYSPETKNNQQQRDERTTVFLKTLQDTTNYMSEVVLQDSHYVGVRRLCRNYQSSCTQSVAALTTQGQTCGSPLKFTCGPACHSCHEMLLSLSELQTLDDCLPDPSTNIFINDDTNDDEDEDDEEDDDDDEEDDDEEDEDTTQIPQKATLDTMFRRIVGEIPYPEEYASNVPPFDATVMSRPSVNPVTHHDRPYGDLDFVVGGPWIVVLDHFLTEEECIRLIEVGDQLGREASTIEDDAEEEDDDDEYDDDEYDDDDDDDDDEYETEEEDEQHRNSLTAWCDDDICEMDPIVQRVQQKIGYTTGVLDPNYFEPFQLLKYREGQYYKEHHDENSSFHSEKYSIDGPRILTFFLYLNEETDDNAIDHETNSSKNNESSTGPKGTMMGGETRFTNILGDESNLHLDIQPKRGRALLWPSMMNADLYEHEIRTYHEARVVHPGYIKYGANVWLHLREHRNTRHTCNETALAPIQDKLAHIPEQ